MNIFGEWVFFFPPMKTSFYNSFGVFIFSCSVIIPALGIWLYLAQSSECGYSNCDFFHIP